MVIDPLIALFVTMAAVLVVCALMAGPRTAAQDYGARVTLTVALVAVLLVTLFLVAFRQAHP